MGLFGKLGRFVLDVVETPVAVVKDVATMGGVQVMIMRILKIL